MSVPKSLESSLYSDRLIVIVLLMSVTIASWLFIINGGGMGMPAFKMTSLDLAYGGGMRMPLEMASWTTGYAVVMFFYVVGDDDCHDATERQYCNTAIHACPQQQY